MAQPGKTLNYIPTLVSFHPNPSLNFLGNEIVQIVTEIISCYYVPLPFTFPRDKYPHDLVSIIPLDVFIFYCVTKYEIILPIFKF